MRLTASLLFICTGLLISACHTTWTIVNSENKLFRLGNVSLKAPIDWVIYNDHSNKYGLASSSRALEGHIQRLMLSKDGFRLDIIDIIRFSSKFAFPTINQAVENYTLPSELSELYIAEQKTLTGINLLTITRNEPTKIAGQNGFLVQFHFRNTSGLYIEQLTYGFVRDHNFYVFSFRAPSLHFFDANIHDFVQLIESLSYSLE